MASRAWLGVATLAAAGLGALALLRSERAPSGPAVVRLVDLYRPESVEPRRAAAELAPRLEWRFDSGARGWQAGTGVAGLGVLGGALTGRATSASPILHVEVPDLPQSELVHEVMVRMRVSGGSQAAAVLRGAEAVDFAFEEELARVVPWPITSPVVPGGEAQAYRLSGSASVLTRNRRRLLLRPTDAAGATFAIESIRLVTRGEHLASVASGLGWQGLSEVYRETLVARAPEAMRFRLRLPPRPRLELSVGTIESWPVRFRVSVDEDGRTAAVAERTVTSADRWEAMSVPLERFGGREVQLSLALSSEREGALGFWGAPVIRPAAGPEGGGRAPVRGVILIWADTLRRDHLEAYGYHRPTAPSVRRLAEQGTLFTDCIAQAAWTKASGPSILTGLYPTTHGVIAIPDRLPAAAATLAEVYREAGWSTVALASIGFVGKMSNLHQGFEEFHESTSLPTRESSSKTGRVLVDRLLSWLERHRDVPFFALLHLADPHSPFRPDPPYDTMWADPARREEHERQAREVRRFIANPNLRRFGMPARDELEKAGIDAEAYAAYERDWYDGSIRQMDAEIARLMERLPELGLDRQVVVAFTSDHGEEFLEHGRMFHAQSVYGEMTNVPLVLWGPGLVPPGRRVEGTVQLVDLMPTLLELAGLRVPPGVQGRSLAPALGPAPARLEPRPAVAEKHARGGGVAAQESASTALFSGRFKLIHHHQRPPGHPEFELFDHEKDPLDRQDLAARHPDVVARLAREMGAWRALAERARLKPDAEAAAGLGREELERLRALGYIQ